MNKRFSAVIFGISAIITPLCSIGQTQCGIEVDKEIIVDKEVCKGDEATITLKTPQEGVSYDLKTLGAQGLVSSGSLSNDQMEFGSGIINNDSEMAIYGSLPLNTSLKLGGTTDQISLDAASFDYEDGYTFEANIKTALPGPSGGHKTILYAGGAAGSDIEIYIQQSTNDLVVLHNRDNSGSIGSLIYNGSIPDDEWFHLAVVYDGINATIYINGTEVASGSVPAIVKSENAEVVIGYFNSTTWASAGWGQKFNGQLDELRLWDDARTMAEIESASNGDFNNDLTDIEAYFKFNEGVGDSVLEEQSGIKFPIINSSTNDLCWLNDSKEKFKHYAISLEGTQDHIVLPANFDYGQAYSFQTWIKTALPTSNSGHRSILYIGNTTSSDLEIYIQESTQNLVILHNRNNGGTTDSYINAGLPDNEWFNLAVSFDGTELSVYINGQIWTKQTITAPLTSANSEITIGYLNSAAFAWVQAFNGAFDDLSLWSKALSEEEISLGLKSDINLSDVNLVHFFDFEEGQESLVNSQPSSTNLQIENPTGLNWIAGRQAPQELALSLESSNDHIALDASSFTYENGYTFSSWVKTTLPTSSGAGHRTLFWAGGASGSDIEVYIQATTKDLVVLHNRDNGGAIHSNVVDKDLPNNEWFHLAVTYDGVTASIYVDGELFSSKVINSPVHSLNSETTIGYFKSSTWLNGGWNQIFNDQLDEISIWNKALTQQEIQGLIQTPLKANETDLQFYFPIETAYSNTIKELVSNMDVEITNSSGVSSTLESSRTFANDFALWLQGNADAITGSAGTLNYDQHYTFESWFKTPRPGSGGGHKGLFFLGTETGSDLEIYVQETTNDLVVLHNRGNGGVQEGITYDQSIPDNKWFHLAVTFNGSSVEAFVNGISLGAQDIVAPVISPNSVFSIGHLQSDDFVWNQTFAGGVDDSRIWNEAKTQQEIIDLVGSELNGDESNLYSLFTFNEGIGDSTLNLVSGTLTSIENYTTGTSWNAMKSKVGNAVCSVMIGEPIMFTVTNPLPLDLSTEEIGNTITSNQAEVMYQWYDCDLSQIIDGETDQAYIASENKNIAVILDNTCETDTSDCINFVVGIDENDKPSTLIYPNPASSNVFVGSGNVTIFDIKGINVLTTISEGWIDISSLEKGIYTLQLGANRQKLLVE